MAVDIERDGSRDTVEESLITEVAISEDTPLLKHADDSKSLLTSNGSSNSGVGDENEDIASGLSSTDILSTFSLLMIGVLISHGDSTLLMATYTTITSTFSSPSAAPFLTTAYTLSTCALQPLIGKLSDILGRKPLLLASYLLFGLGCVLCGISPTIQGVIVGRVISGLGAAGMTVIVTIIIADLVPPREQAQWRSYVNVIATLGRSLGGPLGGLAVDSVGWRWAFAGQGPLMAIAMVLVGLRLPRTTQPEIVKGQPSKWRRIDAAGAGLLSSTILALLSVLSLGGQVLSWSSPYIPIIILTSLIFGTAFVVWETKGALEPIFPPKQFIQRDVATPLILSLLQTAAQLGMMYSVPLYFLATQNTSSAEAGAHVMPAVIGNTVGGLLSGMYIKRTGRYKNLTIASAVFQAVSYGLLILRWKGHTGWGESLFIIPSGFGSAMCNASVFIMLVASVKKEDVAIATSGLYLAGSVGMVVGIAASTAVQLGSLRGLLTRQFGVDNPLVE